jgi:multidrug efflux pump subunit AcrB
MQPVFDKLRRKVEDVRDLPEGVTPIVNDEFGDVFGVIIGLTGEGFEDAELEDVAEAVRDELLRLADVAKVEISGVQEEKIYIEYDNATLARLGFTTAHIQQTLTATNIIFPGGDVRVGRERIEGRRVHQLAVCRDHDRPGAVVVARPDDDAAVLRAVFKNKTRDAYRG